MEDIAQAVAGFVADGLGGIPCEYGEFPAKGGCCMVKASPGEPWVRRYLSGGGIKRFGYEVYLRTSPRGSESVRLDALARLRALQSTIEAGGAPAGIAVRTHEVTSLPSQYAVQQDGCVVYQLTAAITYMAR